jgi:phospholipase C
MGKALGGGAGLCIVLGAMMVSMLVSITAVEGQALSRPNNRATPTSTPIKHLIVVIGENRSFDNVFATYVPPDPKQSVWNLLSQGIVQKTGGPGLNVKKALQQRAIDHDTYQLAPPQVEGGEFSHLPQPSTTLNALPKNPCDLAFDIGYGNVFCSDTG